MTYPSFTSLSSESSTSASGVMVTDTSSECSPPPHNYPAQRYHVRIVTTTGQGHTLIRHGFTVGRVKPKPTMARAPGLDPGMRCVSAYQTGLTGWLMCQNVATHIPRRNTDAT